MPAAQRSEHVRHELLQSYPNCKDIEEDGRAVKIKNIKATKIPVSKGICIEFWLRSDFLAQQSFTDTLRYVQQNC